MTDEQPSCADPWDLDADAAALDASEDDTRPEALLWAARRLWRFLIASEGSPSDVAVARTLTFAQCRKLLDWLAPVERLVVFILHAMALALLSSGEVVRSNRSEEATRAGRRPVGSDPRTASPPPDPTRPHTWRCAFRTTIGSRDPFDRIDPAAPDAEQQIAAWFERKKHRAAQAQQRQIQRQTQQKNPLATGMDCLDPPEGATVDAWPIARRMEALFRVLKDPMRAARRLAAHYTRTGRVPSFAMPPRHRHPWPCSSAIDRAWSRCRDLAETWRAGRLPAPDTT